MFAVKKTYSGKVGGRNDDVAICMQLAITGIRRVHNLHDTTGPQLTNVFVAFTGRSTRATNTSTSARHYEYHDRHDDGTLESKLWHGILLFLDWLSNEDVVDHARMVWAWVMASLSSHTRDEL